MRTGYVAKAPRQARAGADPGSIFQMRMTYTLDLSDRDGDWSWGPRAWSEEDWAGAIKPKLDEFEKLTWAQIHEAFTGTGKKRRRMHHDMGKGDLCQEAQERYKALGQEAETLFRFRLGGKLRLWGTRSVSEFQLLWYDPEHRIYPVD